MTTTATDVYGPLSINDVVSVTLTQRALTDGSREWVVSRIYRSASLVPGVTALEVRYDAPCTPSVVGTLEALIRDEVLIVDAPKMQRDLAPA